MVVLETAIEMHEKGRVDGGQNILFLVNDQFHLALHYLMFADALDSVEMSALRVFDQEHLAELPLAKFFNK
jgi:hypothetical protein